MLRNKQCKNINNFTLATRAMLSEGMQFTFQWTRFVINQGFVIAEKVLTISKHRCRLSAASMKARDRLCISVSLYLKSLGYISIWFLDTLAGSAQLSVRVHLSMWLSRFITLHASC